MKTKQMTMESRQFILFLIALLFLSGLYTLCLHGNMPMQGFDFYEGFDNSSNAIATTSPPATAASIPQNCPNLLIQKGSSIYLYNTRKQEVPGVNPIQFQNLEEYSEFMSWQKSQNISCPVLFLQQTYDPQGQEVYRARPDIMEPQGGINPAQPETRPANYKQNGPQMISDPSGVAAPTTTNNGLNPLYNPYLNPMNTNPTMLSDATIDPPFNTNEYPAYDSSSYYVGRTTPLDQMDQSEATRLPQSTNAMAPNWGGTTFTQMAIDRGDFKGNEVAINVP